MGRPGTLASAGAGSYLTQPTPPPSVSRFGPLSVLLSGTIAALAVVLVVLLVPATPSRAFAARGRRPTAVHATATLGAVPTPRDLYPTPTAAATLLNGSRGTAVAGPQRLAGAPGALSLLGAGGLLAALAAAWARFRSPTAPVVAAAAMTGRYAVLKEDTPMQDGMTESVVKTLKDRYGDVETRRVVKAWRRMEAGVVHTESHGHHPMLVQRCNLFIDGLSAAPRPMWDNADIAWATKLEEGWETIRKELQAVIDMGAEGLAEARSEGWVFPVSLGASEAYGPMWQILNLVERGQWDETASRLFPETCRLLRESEIPLMEAEFALLPARGEILPHTDGWNFMLTAHLPLIVPKNTTAFGLVVGGTPFKWKEGEVLLFDSSFMHEAYNRTNDDRYVLLLRVWHPELTPIEVQALSDLLRTMAERSPEGGLSLRNKPPPSEAYTIEVGTDTWKIPAGCNTFDTRVFGPNVVLYDSTEGTYMACQGGTRFYVEPGREYQIRRLEPPDVQPLRRGVPDVDSDDEELSPDHEVLGLEEEEILGDVAPRL